MAVVLLGLVAAIWLATTSRGAAAEPSARPSATAEYRIVAASGAVDDGILARVDAAVASALPMVRKALRLEELRTFTVLVHGSRGQLPAGLAPMLHEDSPAFAILGQRQVHIVWGELLRLGSSLQGVVTHELVHEVLDQLVGRNGSGIPRWFHEGLAQQIAGDTYLGGSEEDLVWRTAVDRLLPFSELVREFPRDRESMRIAYAQSYSYVSFLVRDYGLDRVVRAARNVDDLTTFERSLAGTTLRSTFDLQEDWRNYLLRRSGAPWRVLLAEWWGMLAIGLLPVLVMALRRRLAAGDRAARQLAATEAHARVLAERIEAQRQADAALAAAYASGHLQEWHGPPLPPSQEPDENPDLDGRDDGRG